MRRTQAREIERTSLGCACEHIGWSPMRTQRCQRTRYFFRVARDAQNCDDARSEDRGEERLEIHAEDDRAPRVLLGECDHRSALAKTVRGVVRWYAAQDTIENSTLCSE